MKKIFALVLTSFILSLTTFGQVLPGVVSVSKRYNGSTPAPSKSYTAIPTPPTFADPQTLVYSTTGSGIQSGDTGGKTDFLVGSDYPFMQFNGLSGSYRIKSENFSSPSTWAELGSPSPNDYSFDAAVSTPAVEWYNLKLIDSDNILKMPTSATPKDYVLQNLIFQNAGFAGALINGSVSGENYGSITQRFCRFLSTGGEGDYWGNTGNQTSTFLGITTIEDFYSYNTGREGIQLNGHRNARLQNITIIGAGQETGAGIGQNNAVQIQNVYTGYLKNFMFWDCRAGAMIATEDFLFYNGVFDWNQADRPIYLQDMVGNGYTKNINHGGTVHFKNVTFSNPDLTIDHVIRIQNSFCNIIFEDCTFPTAATDIYQDDRSDKLTYSITVINPTFSDAPVPTFAASPDAAYASYEQVISDDHYYDLGIGHRTPKQELTIVSVDDSPERTVPNGSLFSAISKPEFVKVRLSDGTYFNTPVTWNEGDYASTGGEFTIIGDLENLPSNVVNTFLVQASWTVNVLYETFTTDFTTPTGLNTWSIPSTTDTLLLSEAIGGGATGSSAAGSTSRMPGGGGGSFMQKANVPVTPGSLLVYYIAPQQTAPLPSGTDLDGLPGGVSYIGPFIPAGSTVISGSGAPSGGTGSDGNYYSDISTGQLYGPKSSGSWPGSPQNPYVRAAGGSNGTGASPGTGGIGGLTSAGIGDSGYNGGNGIAAPASRGGAGGGSAGRTGAGSNATTSGGTNSIGGAGNAPGTAGGNGGASTPGATPTGYGGAGAGARNTSTANTRGGVGMPGFASITYRAGSEPAPSGGYASPIQVQGQSNTRPPRTQDPAHPSGHTAKMWINTTTGFETLEYGVNNNANSGDSPTETGPECELAYQLEIQAANNVFIGKRGQNGTSMFNNWNILVNSTGRSASTQFVQMTSYLAAQGKTFLNFNILFIQGEADVNSANPWNLTGSNTMHYGTGAPSSGLGINGDIYVDKTNNKVYGLKGLYGISGWGSGFKLFDSSGSGAPSSGSGSIGDAYHDTGTGQIYFKTGTSTWSTATDAEACARASYLDREYALIKYQIDALITAGRNLSGTAKFRWIDCLIDNTTDDPFFQTPINMAKRRCVSSFDTDNSGYASYTDTFQYVSRASCSTSDGVHVTTPCSDAIGAAAAAFIDVTP